MSEIITGVVLVGFLYIYVKLDAIIELLKDIKKGTK